MNERESIENFLSGIGQNQSFDELSIGGIPIVQHLAKPLVSSDEDILSFKNVVNGIKLKCKKPQKIVYGVKSS